MVHNQQQADLAAGGGAEARGGSRKRHREGEASEDGEETWSMAHARRQMAVDRATQRKLSAAELQYWKGWEARSQEEACGQKKKGKKGKAQKQQAQQAQKKHANTVSRFRSRHKGANVAMLRPPQIDAPPRGGSSSSSGGSSRNDGDGGGAQSFESLSYSKDHGGGGGGGSSSSSSSSSSSTSTSSSANNNSTVPTLAEDNRSKPMLASASRQLQILAELQRKRREPKQLDAPSHPDESGGKAPRTAGAAADARGGTSMSHPEELALPGEGAGAAAGSAAKGCSNPRPILCAAGPSPTYSDCEEVPCTTAAAAAAAVGSSSAATKKKTEVINVMDFFPKAKAKAPAAASESGGGGNHST